MKSKWLCVAGPLIILGMVALTGCGKSSSPVQASGETGAILTSVATSGYTNAVAFVGTNDSTSTPQENTWSSGGIGGWDTLQPVRFARWYTGTTRSVKVDSITANKTKAWVTITHDLSGLFYVNSHPGDPRYLYVRHISDDKWVRHVYLEKNNAGVWKVMRISPINAQTLNSPITIVKVEATTQSGKDFVITKPDSLYAKSELPTFQPGDSVTLTVTVSVQGGDSSWAFLHRWGRPWLWHIRRPFYRESGTQTIFQRTWGIATEDSVYETLPAIRHAAVDVIDMNALFGDSTQPYYAHGWGFPYVVKNLSDPYPD